MWYLVIPPIVVVLSLAFLLWYLSRKGADPTLAQKILQGESFDTTPPFSRTKAFFLAVLEKLAQRFKVASLKAYNSLHEFLQVLHEKRRKTEERALLRPSVPEESLESKKESSASVGASARVFPAQNDLATPILRKNKEELSLRSMVSETAVNPEGKDQEKVQKNASLEEKLITRIAVNPKDFTAYEELGDYYLSINSIKDAKECYRQVLKLSPVHRMVKIKIRRLEKLLTRAGE